MDFPLKDGNKGIVLIMNAFFFFGHLATLSG